MNDMLHIAIDAMGGDNAPNAIVEGTIQALEANKDIKILLVGDKEKINSVLATKKYDKERVEIIHASEMIDIHDAPVMAIRSKKDSSMVKGLNLVKAKQADAFISAGSTGALLAGGTFIVGRINGIERPALAPIIPTKKGVSLLIDCGANVDAKPSYLLQFAKMGSIYMENIIGTKDPKVALINIGEEEEKGNALVKEVYPLLSKQSFNFIGNIEARDIPKGVADVLVCDAFVGNVLLKYTEGFASTFLEIIKEAMVSNMLNKLCALILKPSLKKALKEFDYNKYGGAPLLGLNGLVIKSHGSADANVIKNTILQCVKFSQEKINEKIKQNI